jgi:RNA polymerase sigma-70 factor (ECF subfamily)
MSDEPGVSPVPSEPERSEKLKLVSMAGAGDQIAQEHLVALLRRRVRTISMAILGHAQDAEDASQCILIEILKSAHSYRGDSLHAWADRIAVRTAVRHARQRRVRATRFEADADAVQLHGPHDSGAAQTIPRPILQYLAELPEARRTVLVLRHVLEYSVAEIAEATGVSPNTVKDRLLQARRQVRQNVRRELIALPAKTRSSS